MYTYKNKTFTSRKIKKLKPKSNDQGAVAANEYMDSRNEKGDAARMQVVNGLRSSDQINVFIYIYKWNFHRSSDKWKTNVASLSMLHPAGLYVIAKVCYQAKSSAPTRAANYL